MKIKPFFRWYDLWVGAYIDTKNRAVYLCPLPTVGLKLQFWRPGICPKCGMEMNIDPGSWAIYCDSEGGCGHWHHLSPRGNP